MLNKKLKTNSENNQIIVEERVFDKLKLFKQGNAI
jgi:hypothetical protein